MMMKYFTWSNSAMTRSPKLILGILMLACSTMGTSYEMNGWTAVVNEQVQIVSETGVCVDGKSCDTSNSSKWAYEKLDGCAELHGIIVGDAGNDKLYVKIITDNEEFKDYKNKLVIFPKSVLLMASFTTNDVYAGEFGPTLEHINNNFIGGTVIVHSLDDKQYNQKRGTIKEIRKGTGSVVVSVVSPGGVKKDIPVKPENIALTADSKPKNKLAQQNKNTECPSKQTSANAKRTSPTTQTSAKTQGKSLRKGDQYIFTGTWSGCLKKGTVVTVVGISPFPNQNKDVYEVSYKGDFKYGTRDFKVRNIPRRYLEKKVISELTPDTTSTKRNTEHKKVPRRKRIKRYSKSRSNKTRAIKKETNKKTVQKIGTSRPTKSVPKAQGPKPVLRTGDECYFTGTCNASLKQGTVVTVVGKHKNNKYTVSYKVKGRSYAFKVPNVERQFLELKK